jgi:hypothetical protein
MKNGSCSATTVDGGTTTLPFVISTGAQRSGEICGSAVPFLEMFFFEERSVVEESPRLHTESGF